MSTYDEFLATKKRRAIPVGPAVSPGDVHPMLHEWQAEIVAWACRTGRAAIFADCGLGKTFMQLEWARAVADTTLILAPLSVARQTVREAKKIGQDVHYVRSGDDVDAPGVWITNYEMVDEFDPATFGAVVLDESSILKNVEGRFRQRLTATFAHVPYRLACTATPAPNDVAELCNHDGMRELGEGRVRGVAPLAVRRGRRGVTPLPPPVPAQRWPCNETPAALAPCSPPVQRAHLAIERRHRGSI